MGCVGTADDDVWYKFTAINTSHLIIVTPETMNNVVFQVFSGTCSGLSNLFCQNGTVGSDSESYKLTNLTIGNTYYIRVYSYYASIYDQGTFTICVNLPPPIPSNDNCSGAITVAVNNDESCTLSTSGTSIGATQSQVGCSGTADDDVWYKFTAINASHLITVTPETMNDVVFQVFSGTCSDLSNLLCRNSTNGSDSESYMLTNLTIGNTYYIRVYSYAISGYQGTFTICINLPPPIPPNDDCSDAITVAVNNDENCTLITSGTSIGATQSMVACFGIADDDVWYKFTASDTSHMLTVTPETMGFVTFQVFSGTCTGLNSLICQNGGITNNPAIYKLTDLTIGETYYIRIYSAYNNYGQGTFTICINLPPPTPPNDNCDGAITVDVNTDQNCTLTTSGTSYGAVKSQPGCNGLLFDDVWYKFTASDTSHMLTVNPGTIDDVVFQVFSGSCANLNSVICQNATNGSNPESAILTGLTVGATYFIQIYSLFDYIGQGTFTICITSLDNMTYSASAAESQIKASIGAGSADAGIIRLRIDVDGGKNPLSVTGITCSTNGSSSPVTNNVINAKLYYTGTSSIFSTNNMYGTVSILDDGNFTIVGNQELVGGFVTTSHYFWLTYDLKCSAVDSDVIDAEFNSFTIGGNVQTPTPQSLAGSRSITQITKYETLVDGNFSDPAIWTCGTPENGTNVPIYIKNNIVLDQSFVTNGNLIVDLGKVFTITNNSFTINPTGSTAVSTTIYGTMDISNEGIFNIGTSLPGTGSANITIASSGTVNVNTGGTFNVGTSTSNTPSNLAISGSFNNSGGTTNVGPIGGGSRTLSTIAATSAFHVSNGAVHINGNIDIKAGTFSQSGGDIIEDGNGVSSSVAFGIPLVRFEIGGGALNLSGGNLIIVDPHFINNQIYGYAFYKSSPYYTNASGNHTIQFGNGSSTTPGGHTKGFFNKNYKICFKNLNVDGVNGTTNRMVSFENEIGIDGDLNVISGELVGGYPMHVAGNIINNGTMTGINLVLGRYQNETQSSTNNEQSITGNGTWRTTVSNPEANIYSLKVNNSNSQPVEIGSKMISGIGTGSIQSTLTLTLGKIDIGSSALTLGISTSDVGTLTLGYGTNSYVIGTLKRWLNASTGERVFPIGTSSTYYPVIINYTIKPTIAGALTTQFIAGDAGSTGLPLVDGKGANPYVNTLSNTGYWQVDASNGLSGGTYTASFTGTSFSGINDYITTRVIKRATSNDNWTIAGNYSVGTGSNAVPTAVREGLAGFSQFAISQGQNMPLPVELTKFTGTPQGKINLLKWETASETNLSKFILERSANGRSDSFKSIDQILAKGNASSSFNYEYSDTNPLIESYYRLKIIDYDESFEYSKVILLRNYNAEEGDVLVYPIPAHNNITLGFRTSHSEEMTVDIRDINGRLVWHQKFDAVKGNNIRDFDISNLAMGFYYLSVYGESVNMNARIIKD